MGRAANANDWVASVTLPAVEFVTLVDASGATIGAAEKIFAHRSGLRHAAFSIFLVDEDERLIIQQRHPAKYHSGGLWANSCCGHPRPGEPVAVAAARRLGEELGVRVPLHFGFKAEYRADVGNGMIENEIVSVFFGKSDETLVPNPDEISQIHRIRMPELIGAIERQPARYACWLRHYFQNHRADIAANCARLAHPVPMTAG